MCPEEENQTSDQKTAAARFVERDVDTVIDTSRRLLWLKKDTWQMTGKWMSLPQVRDFSEELNRKKYGGFKNWRVPTTDEARSLYTKDQTNKDHTGQSVSHPDIFEPGFGFLFWTSNVRNKIQGVRFGYRKGMIIYDDIYRASRGSSRLVRDIDKEDGLL